MKTIQEALRKLRTESVYVYVMIRSGCGERWLHDVPNVGSPHCVCGTVALKSTPPIARGCLRLLRHAA